MPQPGRPRVGIAANVEPVPRSRADSPGTGTRATRISLTTTDEGADDDRSLVSWLRGWSQRALSRGLDHREMSWPMRSLAGRSEQQRTDDLARDA